MEKMGTKVQDWEATFDFIESALKSVKKTGKRNFYDYAADRLRVATTASTLQQALNRFFECLGGSLAFVDLKTVKSAMKAAASENAPNILDWIRELPQIAMAVAKTTDRKDLVSDIVKGYKEQTKEKSPALPKRKEFDIPIKATVMQSLSHGSDERAGNVTLFRKFSPLGCDVKIPFYSGNAIGGIMRDLLADHFTESIGLQKSKSSPPYRIWFFHLLYSGGILGEGAISKEFEKKLGGSAAGALKSSGVNEFRNLFPFMSLLGCVGKTPLEGRAYINNLYPQCKELSTGTFSAPELMCWEFLTKRDDFEGRSSASEIKKKKESDNDVDESESNKSMIVNTECLRANVVLEGGVDISRHTTEIETGALGQGLKMLQELGYLGAGKRRGVGNCIIQYSNIPDEKPYLSFLEKEKDNILLYLKDIGALI
jgi:hypothetical protein